MPRRATFSRPKPKKPKRGGIRGTTRRAPGPPKIPAAMPPAPQAMPFDPNYAYGVTSNQNQLNQGLAGLQYQEGQIKQDYGFDDVSNPYNRAAMLQRAYQQGQSGIQNSMAARGQLYSGANQTAQDEGTFQYQRSQDSLRRSYASDLQGIQQQRLGAKNDYESRNYELGSARAARWEDQRPDVSSVAPAPKPKPKPKSNLPARRQQWRRNHPGKPLPKHLR